MVQAGQKTCLLENNSGGKEARRLEGSSVCIFDIAKNQECIGESRKAKRVVRGFC